MKTGMICLISLIINVSVCWSDVLVAKDQYLFKPASEARRLLLEPGTLLLKKQIPIEDVYKGRIRVVSMGGVEGEVRPIGIDRVEDMSQMLAYSKREIAIKSIKYQIGTVLPLEIIEDDDETLYKIFYPKTTYSVKHKGFVIKERDKEYPSIDFFNNFNMINPDTVRFTKFPLWKQDKRHNPTEWGCDKGSKEEILEIDGSIGGSVEAQGGFFRFFQAKAETSAGVTQKIIYRKKLEDSDFKHRVTYWNLVEAENPQSIILSIALEKISNCRNDKGVNNSYIIRFAQNMNHDEIRLNRTWAEEKKFQRGGGSPLAINSQEDLQRFEKALKDFRFLHTKNGFNIKKAILDFAVQYTVNLNYAP